MAFLNRPLRSGLGVMKLWLTDSGTFPVVFCAGLAPVMGTIVGIRFLLANPDTYFDKEQRATSLHHNGESGDAWRKFRFRMANITRNPINQSRQFDDLFAKEENQNVKR